MRAPVRTMFRFSFLLFLVGRVALLAAPMKTITEEEAFKLPTPERLAAIMRQAQQQAALIKKAALENPIIDEDVLPSH